MTSTRPTARRILSVTGATVVGTIAGLASYSHMREVALDTHQGALIAALIPFSVDGLVLVGTLAIGDGRRSRFTAWLAFLVGVAASFAANVYAADPTFGARAVSAWPSLSFLLAVEVLIRGARAVQLEEPAGPVDIEEPAPVVNETPAAPARSRRSQSAAARVAAARRRTPDASPAKLAARLDLSERTVRRHLAAIEAPTRELPERINGHAILAEVTG